MTTAISIEKLTASDGSTVALDRRLVWIVIAYAGLIAIGLYRFRRRDLAAT